MRYFIFLLKEWSLCANKDQATSWMPFEDETTSPSSESPGDYKQEAASNRNRRASTCKAKDPELSRLNVGTLNLPVTNIFYTNKPAATPSSKSAKPEAIP